VLRNLLNLAGGERDQAGMLRYLNALVTADPDSAQDRALRAGVRFQSGDRAGALQDVDWLLDKQPEGIDLESVREMRRILTRPEK
jgi:hypothetical protein